MFTKSFEKNAGVVGSIGKALSRAPGVQTASHYGGKALRSTGDVVSKSMPGLGGAMKRGGGSMMAHAATVGAERSAKNTANELVNINKAREMQGKPQYKINEKAIQRSAKIEHGKKLEQDLGGVSSPNKKDKNPNFIKKHPYLSAAGIGFLGYKMGQSPGDQVQRPELGY